MLKFIFAAFILFMLQFGLAHAGASKATRTVDSSNVESTAKCLDRAK